MGKTIVEKILSKHCNKNVKAGDFIVANIDLAITHDTTGPIAIETFKQFGVKKVWDPDKVVIFLDHATPSPNERISSIHSLMRDFASENGVKLYDAGEGICHQLAVEKGHIMPGFFAVGTDSHTCTYGAINALSFGIGSTEMSGVFLTGKLWLRVPEVLKIIYTGSLEKGVFSKDLMLYTVGRIGSDGADYLAMEFCGEVIKAMEVSDRLTMCNMSIECGAKAGIMELDEKAADWIKARSSQPLDIEAFSDDHDAEFASIHEWDVSNIVPQVACPHSVDNVLPIDEIQGKEIQQVFVGTCTNGRYDDLEIVARILKGKRIYDSTRLFVCPASRDVLIESIDKGILLPIVEAGGTILPPGCGPCPGTHLGIPSDGERVLSTANRNFKGRMGNNKSEIFLASPATCAASAIEGVIADPRKYFY
jgi:3-isopropylmalate/(R)-2-methylmalate dehydratase large subunit